MASTISDVVLSACDAVAQPLEQGTVSAPALVPTNRRGPQASVLKLEGQIAERRQLLVQLQAQRELGQKELNDARGQAAMLKTRIHDLEVGLAAKGQTALLLISQLDHMQSMHAAVVARAQRIAQTAARPSPPPPPPPDQEGAPTPDEKSAPAARPEERRNHTRTPVVAEVGMTTDNNFYVGFSQDISKGGLFIATPDPLAIGATFLMDCALPEAARPLRCMVEVAWVREYHEGMSYEVGAVPGMGVRFIGLTDEDAAAIAAFQKSRESLFFPTATDLDQG
jgi:uncharacterized protein (TIGR02266 family)